MKAMVLEKLGEPIRLKDLPEPEPGPGEVKIRVSVCGICRTDLHVVDGDLPEPRLPLVLGHQVVGRVVETGRDVTAFKEGDRVGVPWLGGSCGDCRYCNEGRENLCDQSRYTGYQMDGGMAEYCVADARFCFPIPENYPDLQAAPLLCAGLIGYRSYRMTGDARSLGFYGFGAAAHILIQLAVHEGRKVYAFTRPGDEHGQAFAKKLGAAWAGGSDTAPPEPFEAAIIFAPVGDLVPEALRRMARGGNVVCAGIHMSDIPSFPYSILWGERAIQSVANLTRKDGEEFLKLAPEVPIETTVTTYPLEKLNEALDDLRAGRFDGAGVIVVNSEEG